MEGKENTRQKTLWYTKMGSWVGGRLTGQHHQLGGGVLGQGQNWLKRGRHSCREPRGEILMESCVANTYKNIRQLLEYNQVDHF